jgi:hypothetical protein
MSLRDFYMERINLSNDPRFRASMRGSSCYNIVRQNGRTFVQFDNLSGDFDAEEIREIARVHGKLAVERDGELDLNDWHFEVPVEAQVCPCCRGEGKVTDPSIDAGGLTWEQVREFDSPSEWDEAMEGWEDYDEDAPPRRTGNLYLDGHFDVTCPECNGQNVVRSPDLKVLASPLREYVQRYEEGLDADLAERMAEFRMGC